VALDQRPPGAAEARAKRRIGGEQLGAAFELGYFFRGMEL